MNRWILAAAFAALAAGAGAAQADTSFTLTWTAPGDDGLVGNILAPGRYELRYAADSTVASIAAGVELAMPAVAPVGTAQQASITLPTGVWYARVRTSDEAGNWSVWSPALRLVAPDAVPPAPITDLRTVGTAP